MGEVTSEEKAASTAQEAKPGALLPTVESEFCLLMSNGP